MFHNAFQTAGITQIGGSKGRGYQAFWREREGKGWGLSSLNLTEAKIAAPTRGNKMITEGSESIVGPTYQF